MKNVYIIQENSYIAETLKEFFVNYNYKVLMFDRHQSFLSDKEFPFAPGVIILDINYYSEDILKFISLLKENTLQTHVICLTDTISITQLYDLIKHGAADIIEWPFTHKEILTSVDIYKFDSENKETENTQNYKLINAIAKLTNREIEILSLLIKGIRNKEIAYQLNLSTRTIELHRTHINNKLQVKTLMELISLMLCANHSSLMYFKSLIKISEEAKQQKILHTFLTHEKD